MTAGASPDGWGTTPRQTAELFSNRWDVAELRRNAETPDFAGFVLGVRFAAADPAFGLHPPTPARSVVPHRRLPVSPYCLSCSGHCM